MRSIRSPLVDHRHAPVQQRQIDRVEHGLARSGFTQVPRSDRDAHTSSRRAVRSAASTSVRHHHGSVRKPFTAAQHAGPRWSALPDQTVMPLSPASTENRCGQHGHRAGRTRSSRERQSLSAARRCSRTRSAPMSSQIGLVRGQAGELRHDASWWRPCRSRAAPRRRTAARRAISQSTVGASCSSR